MTFTHTIDQPRIRGWVQDDWRLACLIFHFEGFRKIILYNLTFRTGTLPSKDIIHDLRVSIEPVLKLLQTERNFVWVKLQCHVWNMLSTYALMTWSVSCCHIYFWEEKCDVTLPWSQNFWIITIGSLSNDNGNSNGKEQNNNFARASHFFVHCLAAVAPPWHGTF